MISNGMLKVVDLAKYNTFRTKINYCSTGLKPGRTKRQLGCNSGITHAWPVNFMIVGLVC